MQKCFKRRANLKNLKFFKIYRAVLKVFANLLKWTKIFTKPLTRALRYILYYQTFLSSNRLKLAPPLALPAESLKVFN